MMVDSKSAGRALASMATLVIALAGCQTDRPHAAAKTPLIVSARSCADITQAIYFEAGSATVTHPADRLLALAATRSHGCVVTGVAVIGLADSPGDKAANLALSQRRADAVKAALHRHGFDRVEIKTVAAGDAEAVTSGGQDKPVRRRADITFHLAPPAPK